MATPEGKIQSAILKYLKSQGHFCFRVNNGAIHDAKLNDGYGGYQPIRAVFDGQYKLAINLQCEDELYDLKADPEEMKNLISSSAHSTVRDKLHDRLLQHMNETRDPFRGYYWAARPWRKGVKVSFKCDGMTRQRPDDGYEPTPLNYSTGLAIKNYTRKK